MVTSIFVEQLYDLKLNIQPSLLDSQLSHYSQGNYTDTLSTILDLNLISEAEKNFRRTVPNNLWDGDESPENKSKAGYGILHTNLSNDFQKRQFLQSQPFKNPIKLKNRDLSSSMKYDHGSDVFTNGDSYIGKYHNGLRNGYGHYTWK
jgi:hypothetical protein